MLKQQGMEGLPTSGGGAKVAGKKQVIPAWKEHVGPYLNESNFWYKVWLSAGKPNSGSIFENMKSSKKQFKFADRRLKKCSHKIQNEKFASSLLQGGNTNIFEEIRKIRGTALTFSSRIYEEVGAKHFAEMYESCITK